MTVMLLDLTGRPDSRHGFDFIWLLNKKHKVKALGPVRLLNTTTKTKAKPYPGQ